MNKWWILLLIPVVILLIIVVIFLVERSKVEFHGLEDDASMTIAGGADGPTTIIAAGQLGGKDMSYKQITMDEAKEIFAKGGDYIILDVRRADEFAEGHVPGAINVANESIVDTEPAELPDKERIIYVYCRSGNRSKQAAGKLANMGYTNIIECGGFLDWTGEVEK